MEEAKNCKSGRPNKPVTVELIKSTYQPTQAEMKETFTLRKADGSAPTIENIAQAVLRSPGKVRVIDRPRTRR